MSENEHAVNGTPIKRGRGRPRKQASLKPITREAIAAEALKIAGTEGYPALTMNRIAASFGATPRALYNYVSDRQEVVNLAVELFLQSSPMLPFDPANWRETVRNFYRVTRELYRAYPWAAVVPITERLTVDSGPRHAEMMERLLQFYLDLGLGMPQALSLIRAFTREVLAFALQADYYYDRSAQIGHDYVSRIIPQTWLDRHPDVEVPMVREALAQPAQDSDELFEELIQMRLLTIQAMLDAPPATR